MGYVVGSAPYEKWKKRRVKIRKRRSYWLRRYKEAKGCEICGYNKHGVALHFDHIDREQKRFLVSSRNLNLSLKLIFKEARKCRVLCANCHSIETYKNGHFNNTGKDYY